MASTPAALGVVETLVRTCRARIVAHSVRREGFFALGMTLLGICALLLMGTRYVPAATLPLVAMFGVWMAVRRWRSTLPDDYAVAQCIDQREGLRDALSTAFHFRSAGGAWAGGVADAQYERAARAATGVRPRVVFPGIVPATQRNATILLATAALLVGLRAGLQSPLSFEPPLATVLLSSLFGLEPEPPTVVRAALAAIDRTSGAAGTDDLELLDDRPDGGSGDPDSPLPDQSYEPSGEPDGMPQVENLIPIPVEELPAEPRGEEASLQDGTAEIGNRTDEAEADGASEAASDDWNDEAESLLDKLKQAFDNMLQTLDLASAETADADPGREQGSDGMEQASSAGDPAEAGEAADETESDPAEASMEGGQSAEEGSETMSAGNAGGEDSSGEKSSTESASSTGTSDGSKDLVAAEQADVLGALEELYMERAENMTGEVTVETRLADQSARVPYNQRSTVHADRGGGISRDEIPVQYRTYIRNYFQTLRRDGE